MSTGYFALDNPNPNAIAKGYPGFWGYPTMNLTPKAIVIHTTESLADLDGPDSGAENVANWFQTNDTFALYHTLVDSDSTVRVVPAGLDGTTVHTAFHCAGYNSWTIGVSMALRADSWASLPADYRDRVLARAANEVALLCERWNIPVVARTKAEIDAGAAGITGHGILDPGYRTDPGGAFAWTEFIERVRRSGAPTPSQENDMIRVFQASNGTTVLVHGLTYRAITRPWADVVAGLLDLESKGALAPIGRDSNGWLQIPAISDSALALFKEV